jgi:hypothetical protein
MLWHGKLCCQSCMLALLNMDWLVSSQPMGCLYEATLNVSWASSRLELNVVT